MTFDTALRTRERRWRETGTPADGAAALRARLRSGELNAERVATAAALDHPAAKHLAERLGLVVPTFVAEGSWCHCCTGNPGHLGALTALTHAEKLSWLLDCLEIGLANLDCSGSDHDDYEQILSQARSSIRGTVDLDRLEGALLATRYVWRSGHPAWHAYHGLDDSIAGDLGIARLAGRQVDGPHAGRLPLLRDQQLLLSAYLLRLEGLVHAAVDCAGPVPLQSAAYIEDTRLHRLQLQGKTNQARLRLAAELGHEAAATHVPSWGWTVRYASGWSELPLLEAFNLLEPMEAAAFGLDCVAHALDGRIEDEVATALDAARRWLSGDDVAPLDAAAAADERAEGIWDNVPYAVAQAAANLAFAVGRMALPGSGSWHHPLQAALQQALRSRFWLGRDQRKDCRDLERAERAWQAARLAEALVADDGSSA